MGSEVDFGGGQSAGCEPCLRGSVERGCGFWDGDCGLLWGFSVIQSLSPPSKVLWTGLPCPCFHLLVACGILDSEREALMNSGFGFNEILKVKVLAPLPPPQLP